QTKHFQEEQAHQKALLAQYRLSLEEQFRQSKEILQSELLEKEKNLSAQWALKEKEASQRYQEALDSERGAARADVQKAQKALEAERQAARDHMKRSLENLEEERRRLLDDAREKEQAHLARMSQQEAELAALWKQKETELINQMGTDQQKRLEALEA